MKNNMLLTEVSRIREMMGIKLLTEAPLAKYGESALEKLFLGTEKGIESAEKTSLTQAGERAIESLSKDTESGISKKLESAGIRTLEDLAKIGEKGLERAEVATIKNAFVKQAIKELEQSGGSGAIEKILSTGGRNSPTFKTVRGEVAASMESFGTKIDSEYIGFANETLEDLVKLKKGIESQVDISDAIKKELTDDLDNAIATISKNVEEAGGTPFGKSVEQGFEGEIEGAVDSKISDELNPEVKTSIDDALNGVDDIEINIDSLLEAQNPTPEEVSKTFLDAIKPDLEKSKFWSTLRTPEQQEEFSKQVQAMFTNWCKENKVVADKFLLNNDKNVEALVKVWNNPATAPSTKIKMIEDATKSLNLKWGPRDLQYWKNYIQPWKVASSGEILNPFTKEGFNEYFKKYMIVNLALVGAGIVKDVVTGTNVGYDNLPGDNWLEKRVNLFQPGEAILKTFLPFIYSYPVLWGMDAATNEFRAPSEKEVIEFLKTTLDVSDKTKYEILVDVDNKITVVKDKNTSETKGSYSYDNVNKKIVVNNGLKPGDLATPPPNQTIEASKTDFKTWYDASLYKSTPLIEYNVDGSDKTLIVAKGKNSQGVEMTIKFKKQNDGSYAIFK